jgi:hypothetical protein
LLFNVSKYSFIRNLLSLRNFFWDYSLSKVTILPTYYLRSELIWQDGFLFDFLQKKTADAWVRRFVIYTGFLFSERLVFDSIVYLYINNIINTAHSMFIFESSSVSEMLNTLIFYILSLFFISFLLTTSLFLL